jgi:hypothetical protein
MISSFVRVAALSNHRCPVAVQFGVGGSLGGQAVHIAVAEAEQARDQHRIVSRRYAPSAR